MNKKKIKGLCVYINVGAGFKAPAVSIAESLIEKGMTVETLDFFKSTGLTKLDNFWKKSWVQIVSKTPGIMNFFSLKGFELLSKWFFTVKYNLLYGKRVLDWIRQHNPDFIISTHFVSSNFILRVVRKNRLPVSVFAYNAEVLGSHVSDIYPDIDAFFVASKEGFDRMTALGQPEDKIVLSGFPLNKKYRQHFPPVRTVRTKLGLDPDRFTVLFSFGGEGIGDISIIKRILETYRGIQVVAVCGRSEVVRKKLEAVKEKYSFSNLFIYGFVSNMPELLYSCDISAGKSGMNLAFESIFMKKPFLVTMAMANEVVTAEYIRDNGFGWYPKNTEEQVQIIGRCIDSTEYYRTFVQNLEQNSISFDAGIIVKAVEEITQKNKKKHLQRAAALYFDLAGTLCDIPISGQWEEINSTGIRNVIRYLSDSLHKDFIKDGMDSAVQRFVKKKAELRKKAKLDLKEYPIRSQLLDFFKDSGFSGDLSPEEWDRLEYLFIKPELDITVGFKGIEDLLSSLGRRYDLYLLSNNVSRRLVTAIMDKLNITSLFKGVFVSADCGFRKPHPGFLKYVTSQTGVAPENAVMIGDRLTQDVKMANDYGLKSVFVNIVDHEDNAGAEDFDYFYMVEDIMDLHTVFLA